MKLVCGIDEAGRGPVLGSMFIGGVIIPEKRLEEIEEKGLKDSKKLSDSRRRELEPFIRDKCEKCNVIEVSADEIDQLRQIMSLNVVEINCFVETIKELEPDRALIDLPEPDGKKFAAKIRKKLPERLSDIEIIAEHGADDTYPIVSAASIIAKNAREDHVESLRKKYGRDFGSGYPHDMEATGFIEEFYRREGEFPNEARESWSTCEKMIKENEQSGLKEFSR